MSIGLSRQEYWSRVPFHSSRDLPDPGTEPGAPGTWVTKQLLVNMLYMQLAELKKLFQCSELRHFLRHPIKDFYPEFFPEANWVCEDHRAQVFHVLYSSHSYVNTLPLS